MNEQMLGYFDKYSRDEAIDKIIEWGVTSQSSGLFFGFALNRLDWAKDVNFPQADNAPEPEVDDTATGTEDGTGTGEASAPEQAATTNEATETEATTETEGPVPTGMTEEYRKLLAGAYNNLEPGAFKRQLRDICQAELMAVSKNEAIPAIEVQERLGALMKEPVRRYLNACYNAEKDLFEYKAA